MGLVKILMTILIARVKVQALGSLIGASVYQLKAPASDSPNLLTFLA
jgi:hypothetical protein